MYVCIHTYTYVHVYIYIYAYTYIYIYIQRERDVHLSLSLSLSLYLYTFIYIYIYMYIFIFIFSSSRKLSGRFFMVSVVDIIQRLFYGFRCWFSNGSCRGKDRFLMVSIVCFFMVPVVAGKTFFMVSAIAAASEGRGAQRAGSHRFATNSRPRWGRTSAP